MNNFEFRGRTHYRQKEKYPIRNKLLGLKIQAFFLKGAKVKIEYSA